MLSRGCLGDERWLRFAFQDHDSRPKPRCMSELRVWNYDGTFSGQAAGENSEVYRKPSAMFHDPFRQGDNLLVFCGSVDPNTRNANATNTRSSAAAIFEISADQETWFGIEQNPR